MNRTLAYLLIITVWVGAASTAPAAEFQADRQGFEQKIQPFLKKFCLDCHGTAKQEGELRLDGLSAEIHAEQSWDTWHEVLNRLNEGSMPPEKAKQPTDAERLAAVEWLEGQLRSVRIALEQSGSQPAMRRLNRSEYQNTIRDLLGIPYDDVIHHPQLVHAFPADPTVEGFDTVSSGLSVSSLHMEKYLKHGRAVIETALAGPEAHHWRIDFCEKDSEQYRQILKMAAPDDWSDGAFRLNLRSDRSSDFREVWPLPQKLNSKWIYDPQRVAGDVYLIDRSLKDRVENHTFIRFDTLRPGIYRFTLRGRVASPAEGPALVTLMRGSKKRYAQRDFTVTHREYQTFELLEYLPQDLDAAFMAYVSPVGKRQGRNEFQFEIDYVEVEGPLRATDDAEQEFFLGTREEILSREWSEPEITELLRHFMGRVYRRPASDSELARVMEQYRDALAATDGSSEALTETLGFLLASPEFIHLGKPGDQAAEHADYRLASRLSYFLWSSLPDAELFRLAESGELSKPEVLDGQVERMLDDPKSDAFVRNFAGQWLRLREIADIIPEKEIYPEYNEELQDSMAEETYRFFGELLRHDLSVLNFIDSDFTMLNERLARFYGMRTDPDQRNIQGQEFRRVSLEPDDHRGGLLAQASILKLTSTCTRVSPVKRGAFILENLLGITPTPPPPNVEEVVTEAPGTGPTTLRELLEQHRTQATCAACHAKIDPLGFALHHYDAIGAYRTHEGSGKKRVREPTGGPIDATGTLPDGRSFDGLDEFKTILLDDKDQFTRTLTKKLLTYALGRPMHPGDEAAIDSIQTQLQADDYRFRALIKAIVRSRPFLHPQPAKAKP